LNRASLIKKIYDQNLPEPEGQKPEPEQTGPEPDRPNVTLTGQNQNVTKTELDRIVQNKSLAKPNQTVRPKGNHVLKEEILKSILMSQF